MPTFPVHYRPRPYQVELHKMWRTKRYGIAVLPRQTGKDVAASMEQCDARLRTPKTTGVYISPVQPDDPRHPVGQDVHRPAAPGEYIRGLQDNVPRDSVDWKGTVHGGPVLQPQPAEAAGLLPVRPGQGRCRHVLPGLHHHRAGAVQPGGSDPPHHAHPREPGRAEAADGGEHPAWEATQPTVAADGVAEGQPRGAGHHPDDRRPERDHEAGGPAAGPDRERARADQGHLPQAVRQRPHVRAGVPLSPSRRWTPRPCTARRT